MDTFCFGFSLLVFSVSASHGGSNSLSASTNPCTYSEVKLFQYSQAQELINWVSTKDCALSTQQLSSPFFSQIGAHGCWCNAVNEGIAHSKPIDDVDLSCRSWTQCSHCASSQVCGEVKLSEVAFYVAYTAGLNSYTCLKRGNDPRDLCDYNHCLCALNLALSVKEQVKNQAVYNPSCQLDVSDPDPSEKTENTKKSHTKPDMQCCKVGQIWEVYDSNTSTCDVGGILPNNVTEAVSTTTTETITTTTRRFVPDVTRPTIKADETTTSTTEATTTQEPSSEEIVDICSSSIFDLNLIIDGSGSISPKNFNKAIDFLQNIVNYLSISSSRTTISLMQFSSFSKFYTTNDDRKSSVDQALENLRNDQFRGWTMTNYALDAAYNSIKDNARFGIPQIALVMTDGNSTRGLELTDWNSANMDTYNTAEQLLNHGVEVFTLGIGKEVDLNELNEISSNPDSDHVSTIKNFNFLEEVEKKLAKNICQSNQNFDVRTIDRLPMIRGLQPHHDDKEDLRGVQFTVFPEGVLGLDSYDMFEGLEGIPM